MMQQLLQRLRILELSCHGIAAASQPAKSHMACCLAEDTGKAQHKPRCFEPQLSLAACRSVIASNAFQGNKLGVEGFMPTELATGPLLASMWTWTRQMISSASCKVFRAVMPNAVFLLKIAEPSVNGWACSVALGCTYSQVAVQALLHAKP